MKLSDEEKKVLRKIHLDEELQTFFGGIVAKRLVSVDTLSMNDNNWALKRAKKDGQIEELEWLASLLKQKE